MKPPKQPASQHILNEAISYEKVFVVDANNQPISAMTKKQMLDYATNQGLDAVLIAISPKPIVKLMDYGKYRYQKQKDLKAAKQSQIVHKMHQINISLMISDHDLEIKLNKCKDFLLNFDPVKIQVRKRGREMQRPELLSNLVDKISAALNHLCADFQNQIKTKGRLVEWTLQPVKQKIIQWKEQNGS